MSLKAFHIFFITGSIALMTLFGLWALSRTGAPSIALAIFSFGVAAGLVVYEVLFLRKCRRLGLGLVFLALVPDRAWACPVCFGQSDSPAALGVTLAIWMMLGLTVIVLGGFATFFIYLIRRARLAHLMGGSIPNSFL